MAILSGRTARDVAARVRVGGATYLGNHGLERGVLARRRPAEALRASVDATLAGYAADVARLAEALPRLVPEPWLIVEPKAPAISFHYRSAPAAAAALVAAAVELLDPARRFVRFAGRRVLELRPPGATGKGEAMLELLEERRPAVAIALGDDASDAAAVAAAADAMLASPLEAARFLAGLAAHLA